MSSVWFTSDTHFGHEKCARIRGYDTAESHDDAIVEAWNSTVRPGDVVWHLGDVGLASTNYVLGRVQQLHGIKNLVTGNHDPCHPKHRDAHKRQRDWLTAFFSVQAFARRRFGTQQVLLSHYPYVGDHTDVDRDTQFRLRDEGLPLLCGHVHDLWAISGRQINVGLDVQGMRPVHLDEVARLVRLVTS